MANLIFNKLRIESADLKSISDFIKGKNGAIDFQKISPVPRDCPDQTKWCWRNWGTKWNAVSPSLEGNVVTFDTPWSAPVEIAQRLSEKFKDAVITLMWDDGANYNCGMVEFKGGHQRDSCCPDTSEDVARFLSEYFDNEDIGQAA